MASPPPMSPRGRADVRELSPSRREISPTPSKRLPTDPIEMVQLVEDVISNIDIRNNVSDMVRKKTVFSLKTDLQNPDFAEEMISRNGVALLLEIARKGEGNVQSYALMALRVAVEYYAGLQYFEENEELCQALVSMMDRSTLEAGLGNVCRSALEVLMFIAHVSPRGVRLVHKGFKRECPSHQRPYGQIADLINHSDDFDLHLDCVTLINTMIMKAEDSYQRAKLVLYFKGVDMVSTVKKRISCLPGADREELKANLACFQELMDTVIPRSWLENDKLKEKIARLDLDHSTLLEENTQMLSRLRELEKETNTKDVYGLSVRECLEIMRAGMPLLKVTSQGQGHFRTFQLTPDNLALVWFSPKAADDKNAATITDIIELREGHTTPVFEKYLKHDQPAASLSFSLVLATKSKKIQSSRKSFFVGRGAKDAKEQRTVDLVCRDSREYRVWTKGLTYLIDEVRKNPWQQGLASIHQSDTQDMFRRASMGAAEGEAADVFGSMSGIGEALAAKEAIVNELEGKLNFAESCCVRASRLRSVASELRSAKRAMKSLQDTLPEEYKQEFQLLYTEMKGYVSATEEIAEQLMDFRLSKEDYEETMKNAQHMENLCRMSLKRGMEWSSKCLDNFDSTLQKTRESVLSDDDGLPSRKIPPAPKLSIPRPSVTAAELTFTASTSESPKDNENMSAEKSQESPLTEATAPSPPKATPPPPPPGPGMAPPPPPPNARAVKPVNPKRPVIKPGKKLKALHWRRMILDDEALNNSVWSHCDDMFKLDFETLESKFPSKPPAAPQASTKKATSDARSPGTAKTSLRVLDRKRYEAVTFVLRKVPSAENIMAAVLDMNSSKMSEEQILMVLNLLPTNEEIELLKAAAEEHGGIENVTFDKPEQFLFDLGGLPHLRAYLKTWQFYERFAEQIAEVERSCSLIEAACETLRTSKSLKVLLGATLAIGNYLNGGTDRGQADGFSLNVLSTLADVKDASGKDSLLVYVQEFIEGFHQGMCQKFVKEMACLKHVRKLSIALTRGNFNTISTNYKGTRAMIAPVLLQHQHSASGVRYTFYGKIASFLGEAEKSLKAASQSMERIGRNFDELLQYFSIPKQDVPKWPSEVFFDFWFVFAESFGKTRVLRVEKDKAVNRPGYRKSQHIRGQKVTEGGFDAVVNQLKAGLVRG